MSGLLPGPPQALLCAVTNSSWLPGSGVGQKSFEAELTGAWRFIGVSHVPAMLARSATQMSLLPRLPGRFEARNSI